MSDTVFNPLSWPYPVPEQDIVLHLTVDGQPVSKARREYERRLRGVIQDSLVDYHKDAESSFGLRCMFYRNSRQRIDCDNLIKAVSDAATGEVWKDDNQVVEVIGRLFVASDTPHAEIVIYRLPNPAPRKQCLSCGKEFVTYPSLNADYCSQECYQKSTHATVVCKECGKEFEIIQSLAKKRAGFCSRHCSMVYHGRKKTTERGPQTWKCRVCGGPVSRKEYELCRACSMKERMLPTSNYWKVRYGTRHDDPNEPRVEVEVRRTQC